MFNNPNSQPKQHGLLHRKAQPQAPLGREGLATEQTQSRPQQQGDLSNKSPGSEDSGIQKKNVGISTDKKPVAQETPAKAGRFSPAGSRQASAGVAASTKQNAAQKAATSIKSEKLKESRQIVFDALLETMDMSSIASMRREDAEKTISELIIEIINVHELLLGTTEQKALIEEICDEVLGYGPLEPLLERDDIADIMVNGFDQTYIEVEGKVHATNVRFRSNKQLMDICQRIVSEVGRRVDESSPMCDARLQDGSRVNVIVPPLAIEGPVLTIRKFREEKLKFRDLITLGSISPDGAKVLEIIGAVRCNVIISGGTGSGKTTLLNCLSSFASENERIVTCEDSAELQLQQPHVVRLETRPPNLEGAGEVTMRDLVRNCLRMRPERIIVGEVRGFEAFDLLQSMNTGHDGSMGTLHANSPREALSRLESMITMGGASLPSKTIREMICSAVNVIVQVQRLRDGSRRITHISEIMGMEGETIVMQDIVRFEIGPEDSRGNITGRHISTGVGRPRFYEKATLYNRAEELQSVLAEMEASTEE